MSIRIILLLILTASAFPQSLKWGKAEVDYIIPSVHVTRDYSVNGSNVSEVVSKSFINLYWFFISDVDGDNCPYYPSCSSFFIQSVKETNLLQGTLMFADRFTRDINIFNRAEKYPIIKFGKYYDPPYLYRLDDNLPELPVETGLTGRAPVK